MRWYIQPNAWLPLKLLVAVWLAWAIAISVYGAAIRSLASFWVLLAVAAAVHGLLLVPALFIVLPALLGLVWAPAWIYGMQAFMLPRAWLGQQPSAHPVATSFLVLVAGGVVAWLFSALSIYAIAWIADLNPCASLAAGVTGNSPCVR